MRMHKPLRFLLAAAAAIALAGCIDTQTTITVKADGSGTIEKTIILSKHLPELMQSMGNKDDPAKIAAGMLNEQGLKAGAARMGTGVSFVSATKVSSPKGDGYKAVYSFKDINAVKISQNPTTDLTMPGVPTTNAVDKESFAFTFKKGSPASLSIAFPKTDASATSAAASGAPQNADEKMMAKIKELYADMRVVLAIAVDGSITATNASYVSGSTVTIVDMDFGKVIANDAVYTKLKGMQGQSMAEVRKVVKAVPGIKVEDKDPVTISFK